MTERVVIAASGRTAIGNFGGTLAGISASELGAHVIAGVVERAGIEPKQVDEVITGQVLTGGAGQNPARQAAIKAGLPEQVPAMTVNKVCGSGLKSVVLAAQAVALGDAEVVVAGGQESMSTAPHVLPGSRTGTRMGDARLVDSMINDGLWDAFNEYHMGVTAENIASHYNISRADQDAFAATSQQRAEQALKTGRFEDEVLPIEVPQKKGDPVRFARDEFPRAGVTAERLAAMQPAFQRDGTVTAGNASGINDGAAAVIVASERKARELGLTPLATIESYAHAGVDPAYMGIGPVPATKRCLARADWSVADLDLIEANEAFAAQSIAVGRQLDWDSDRVNVNGGAIALGHPIGASGCRILVTLTHEMQKREVGRGLATLCIGGGQGIAMAVSRG